VRGVEQNWILLCQTILLQGREGGGKGAGEGAMRHQAFSPALALDGRFFAGAAAAFCVTIFLWPTIAMPPLPPLADPPRPTLLEGGTGFLEPRIILARMRGHRGPRDYSPTTCLSAT
jgi:hypothetical protein